MVRLCTHRFSELVVHWFLFCMKLKTEKKKKSLPACVGGQGPSDGTDGEEAERCPICLGVPPAGEVAMPDSCCHVFCLRCLLTWAKVSRHRYKTIQTSCSVYFKLRLLRRNKSPQGFGSQTFNLRNFQFADVCFLPGGQKAFQQCLQLGREPGLRAGLHSGHIFARLNRFKIC